MSDGMRDDATVERNSQRHKRTTRRLRALGCFMLFAFLLLSVRTEINAGETNANADRITMTQRVACLSGLEILVKFNLQQDALIEIERTNRFIDDDLRAARIETYEKGRIDPLPICEAVPAE